MIKKIHVKKGDTVVAISGKNKGKRGTVLEVSPSEGKVIVEGVNMVTKHVKPRKQGDPGGIIKAEGALYACKVMIYCTGCEKPVRVGHKILDDGEKIRYCKSCGDTI